MSSTSQKSPVATEKKIEGVRIRVEGLIKRYGQNTILNELSMEIAPGETVTLIGPSGGGKSTFLRCLNGLNPFDAGRVQIGDHLLEPNKSNPVALRQIRSSLGMIFQDFQLFPHLTALENVIEAPCRVASLSNGEARELGAQLLKEVGLGERLNHFPKQLSGGQKQRVAIARALAMKPRGLLCDEITSALDPELKWEVLEVLEKLKARGMTLVMVTHEIGFARKSADRVFVLAGGRIIEHGPPSQVIDNPQVERNKLFLSRVLG